ncbi:hypothetical protein K2173_021994 [Erythroxylum novogranatense]|uniref:Uncharacterized protein n=1 Tax=Erythroxylum novogranatense TaxID=1862640 RepID=A0AAV8T2H0_9ROSI|nr:hypothetical protein K2173_021994 [Erythroxylum novogranatense]
MALYFQRKWRALLSLVPSIHDDEGQEFQSNTALELMKKPSFSVAFSALFAQLFHLQCRIPSPIMPFPSVESLRCYLLGFPGLSRFSSKVKFFVDVERSSSNVANEHFTSKLVNLKSGFGKAAELLDLKNSDNVEMVLNLPDIKAFNVGLNEKRTMVNCITNPHFYKELLAINAIDVISNGKISFLIQGVRVDGHSYLSDEIGKQLSIKSFIAGLSYLRHCINVVLFFSSLSQIEPIGAIVYWQRTNLKMCLRTFDSATDTSKVAKAYGGGGSSSSSSFIIRMDECNQWLSV